MFKYIISSRQSQNTYPPSNKVKGKYFYPVEEFFKLLCEQLHSSGLHRSAKCAIEELQY